MLPPNLLNRLWRVIETIPSYTILELSDRDLMVQILEQFPTTEPMLSHHQPMLLAYLISKLRLIRDCAEARNCRT